MDHRTDKDAQNMFIPINNLPPLPRDDTDRGLPLTTPRYEPPPSKKVTVGKTAAMRDDWYDAVINHHAASDTPKVQHLVQLLMQDKLDSKPKTKDRDKNIIKTKELEKVFPIDLPRQLVARSAAATGQDLGSSSLEINDAYIRHMNQNKAWRPIQHDIQSLTGQKSTSTITPVNQHYHETFGDHGETGLGSMSGRLAPETRSDEEKQRPVNLWKTSLTEGPKTLFEGFRSGAFVDSAKDDREKTGNAQQRATGVLRAALVDRLNKMGPTERQMYLTGFKAYEGTMVSIDLLSASLGDSGLANEHHQTIHDVSGKTFVYQVTYDGTPCKVFAKFDILDFKTGANAMNAQSGKMPLPGLSSKSSTQDKENQRSWETLSERAAVYVAKNAASDDPELKARARKVNLLRKNIAMTGLGSSGSYQLPAMLANLAFLLDASVHFNCKSGKDRTGIMDAETKFMARELEHPRHEGLLPSAKSSDYRDHVEDYHHEQMLWESGNLDVLAQNVGGQCLKTADMAQLKVIGGLQTTDRKLADNLGGDDRLEELGGLKRYADIDTIATFKDKIFNTPRDLPFWEVAAYQKQAKKYLKRPLIENPSRKTSRDDDPRTIRSPSLWPKRKPLAPTFGLDRPPLSSNPFRQGRPPSPIDMTSSGPTGGLWLGEETRHLLHPQAQTGPQLKKKPLPPRPENKVLRRKKATTTDPVDDGLPFPGHGTLLSLSPRPQQQPSLTPTPETKKDDDGSQPPSGGL